MPRDAPMRDRVLRALLSANIVGGRQIAPLRGKTEPLSTGSSVYALAQTTQVAFAWAHETLAELHEQGWLADNNPMQVRNASAIFEWWHARRKPPDITSLQVQDVQLMSSKLRTAGRIENVVTTYYAENRFQGHLFPRRMDVYVPAHRIGEARQWLIKQGAQIGGVNFRLWSADQALLEDALPGAKGPMALYYAPIPQVILDLMWEDGSAREAAEMMIKRYYTRAP